MRNRVIAACLVTIVLSRVKWCRTGSAAMRWVRARSPGSSTASATSPRGMNPSRLRGTLHAYSVHTALESPSPQGEGFLRRAG